MALPRLRKFEITVLKDQSGVGSPQIPASGVTVKPYRQGTSMRNTATVTNGATNQTINVWDATNIQVGDVLAQNANATPTVTVDQIVNDYQIRVDSDGNGTMTLAVYDRLVVVGPSGRVPDLYQESSGVAGAGTSLTTDASGYASCYMRERFTDVKLSGGSVVTQIRQNYQSGDDEYIFHNAFEYPGGFTYLAIQNAIDALPAFGGTVYIPAGFWDISTAITVTKDVILVGDGQNKTILSMNSSKNVNCFTVTAGVVTIKELSIYGPGGSPGTGTGIAIQVGNSGGATMGNFTCEKVYILDSPSYGIKIGDKDAGWGYIITSRLEDVNITTPRSGAALYLSGIYTSEFVRVTARNTNCATGVVGFHIRDGKALRFQQCEINYAPDTLAILDEESTFSAETYWPIGNTYVGLDIEQNLVSMTVPVMKFINGHNITVRELYNLGGETGVIEAHSCFGLTVQGCAFVDMHGTQKEVKLVDCTSTVMLNNYAYGAQNPEVPRLPAWEESGSTNGTIMIGSGVVVVPSYATGSLPAYAANKIPVGSLAYDTTTNNLKVIDTSNAWVKVGTQT